MKKLSIIIITYNRAVDLLELLEDITRFENTALLEDVIVLNNKSTDDYSSVYAFIEQNKHVNFNLVEAPENLGVSRGRNYATQFAKGEIFVYFDDDINIKDKGVLEKIAACFTHNDSGRKLGAVSFKVLYSSNGLMQVNAFAHKKFAKYKDMPEFFTYYYTGCAHAITKEAWDITGDYPTNFFYGMEEYDFSYRLLNHGYCIKYDASVVIYHKESPLGRKPKPIKLRMMWVNKCKVAWRYLPKRFFYTTAVMWGLEFLIKTGFNIPNFLLACKEIIQIPRTEKRAPVNTKTLEYLKKVEARLWY